jgi:hypothetical protein
MCMMTSWILDQPPSHPCFLMLDAAAVRVN